MCHTLPVTYNVGCVSSRTFPVWVSEAYCGSLPTTRIESSPLNCHQGKLLVDGYCVPHELYDSYKLEWASGGCYADQHKATLDYFKASVKAAVEPIVIIGGGGTETNMVDMIYRRNRDINYLPALLR